VKDLNEITIANITPYPDFAEIAHELERLGLTHPLLTSPNPVVADIEQAAMEGEIDAIDAQRVIDRLRSAG
jgi:hypothetical protein